MISKRLKELQMKGVQRVIGVDMRRETAMENAKDNGWVPQAFNFTQAQDNAYKQSQLMGSILGTTGCAAAHFKAQAKAIEDGKPLAIILEDDAWLEEDFVERLWSLVSE